MMAYAEPSSRALDLFQFLPSRAHPNDPLASRAANISPPFALKGEQNENPFHLSHKLEEHDYENNDSMIAAFFSH
jgi:hypothetical protein